MAAIANVALSDTFNTQRVKLNRSLVRLNNFANNESQLTANAVFANVSLTAAGNLDKPLFIFLPFFAGGLPLLLP